MRAVWRALRVSGEGPAPRCSHTATMLPGKDGSPSPGLVVIGGGSKQQAGWRHFGDAWFLCFTKLAWRQLPIEGDPFEPRRGHTTVVIGDTLFVFGGARVSADDEEDYHQGAAALKVLTMSPDGSSLRCVSHKTGPRGRRAHVAAVLPGEKFMVVFGGHVTMSQTEDDINERIAESIVESSTVHLLQTETMAWTKTTTDERRSPPDKLLQCAVRGVALGSCAVARGRLWITGGISACLCVPGGVNSLEIIQRDKKFEERWTKLNAGDDVWRPRYGAASCSIQDRFVLLCGGAAASEDLDAGEPTYLDALRVLDLEPTLKQQEDGGWVAAAWSAPKTTNPPSKRNAATATTITTRGGEEVVLLFGGGVFNKTYQNDLHLLRLTNRPISTKDASSTLQGRCEEVLADQVTTETVLDLLAIAHTRACELLQTRCLAFIQEEFGLLSSSRRTTKTEEDDFRKRVQDLSITIPALKTTLTRALEGL